MKSSLDPLLFGWLNYKVTYRQKLNRSYSVKSETAPTASSAAPMPTSTESAISDSGSKKKKFPSLDQSVHSSSDKEKKIKVEGREKSSKKSTNNKTIDSDKLPMTLTNNENDQGVRKN